MHGSGQRDKILIALARGFRSYVDVVQIFVLKKDLLAGYLQLSPDGKDEGVRQYKMTLTEDSLVSQVVKEGTMYLGPVPAEDGISRDILLGVGLEDVKDVALVPVQIKDRTICLALGHRGDQAMPALLHGALSRLGSAGSAALKSMILRKKRATAPQKVVAPARAPHEDLIDALGNGGAAAQEAVEKLPTMGNEAMDALIARFPGDVALGFASSNSPLRPVSECSALLKALVGFGRDVVPAITHLLHHADSENRFYATFMLSELVFPEAIVALAARLRDEDASVRWIAAQALKRFKSFEHFDTLLMDLYEDLGRHDSDARQKACEAFGNLGDGSVVKALTDLLTDTEAVVVESAHTALVNLTKVEMGLDKAAWLVWWDVHRDEHRLRWLIDGLVHEDGKLRSSSATELAELTGMTYGYESDLPIEERVAVRDKFLEWWETTGQEEFC